MLKALNVPPGEFTSAAQQFILSTGTNALVVWVPNMAALMPTDTLGLPAIDQQGWTRGSPSIDDVIAWCDAHKIRCIMVQDFGCPPWAYANRTKQIGKPPVNEWGQTYPPDDLTPAGPWAKCVAHAMRRHPQTFAIVIGNEPNIWQSSYPPSQLHKTSAQAIKTAAHVAKTVGYQGRVLMLGIEDDENHQAQPFLEGTLKRLNGWPSRWRRYKPPPGVRMGMAWHPYTDVTNGQTSRAAAALRLLRRYRFPGHLWCTEGGYVYQMTHQPGPYPLGPNNGTYYTYTNQTQEEQAQLEGVSRHIAFCRRHNVGCWANYEYQETGWAGWASGLVDKTGKPHPLHNKWAAL